MNERGFSTWYTGPIEHISLDLKCLFLLIGHVVGAKKLVKVDILVVS